MTKNAKVWRVLLYLATVCDTLPYMPQTTEPITVSVKTAGEMLGLSTWQVKQRCDSGLIESVFEPGPRGQRLVLLESIRAYVASLPSERPSDGAA